MLTHLEVDRHIRYVAIGHGERKSVLGIVGNVFIGVRYDLTNGQDNLRMDHRDGAPLVTVAWTADRDLRVTYDRNTTVEKSRHVHRSCCDPVRVHYQRKTMSKVSVGHFPLP